MNVTVIEASKSERAYWHDLWKFRELLFFFSWRDLIVRYKQTVFGVLWAFLRPFITMLIFVFVFKKLANVPSDGLPYPVMLIAGMIPWMFFSAAVAEASYSLVTNGAIISKVYFPRLMMPASAVLVTFVDFGISLLLLIGLMIFYGVHPHWQLFLMPVFTLCAVAASFGASLWFAALNVKYRDFRYIITFMIQLGIYVTPVGYPSGLVRDRWGSLAYHLFSLNPMVGVINGFRWSVGGSAVPMDWGSLIISLVITTAVGVSGLLYFRATEDTFADVI